MNPILKERFEKVKNLLSDNTIIIQEVHVLCSDCTYSCNQAINIIKTLHLNELFDIDFNIDGYALLKRRS